MKITYRLPGEMYAFIEVEEEIKADSTFIDTYGDVGNYIRIKKEGLVNALKPQPVNSLPKKEFDAFIDRMLSGENNHIEEYTKMSPQQQDLVQCIKRSIKRLNYKAIRNGD